MKALSVRQPWASMIASGQKTVELRTWTTDYRGPLLICASSKSCGDLPTGVALCVVKLTKIRPAMASHAASACCEIEERDQAWTLTDVRLIEPFPVSGRLGLFDVELPRSEEDTTCGDTQNAFPWLDE